MAVVSQKSAPPPVHKFTVREYSRMQLLVFKFLVLGVGLHIGAIVTDHWSDYQRVVLGHSLRMNRGLINQCTYGVGGLTNYTTICQKRWSKLALELRDPDTGDQLTVSGQDMKPFEISTMVLLGLSVVVGVLSAAVAMLTAICNPYSFDKHGGYIAFSVLLAAVFSVAAIGLYAGYAANGETMTFNILAQKGSPRANKKQQNNEGMNGNDNDALAFSFYLTVGGCGFQTLSGLFYGWLYLGMRFCPNTI